MQQQVQGQQRKEEGLGCDMGWGEPGQEQSTFEEGGIKFGLSRIRVQGQQGGDWRERGDSLGLGPETSLRQKWFFRVGS